MPRSYATIDHPTIQAVLERAYRYRMRDDAEARLNELRKAFVTSKYKPEGHSPEALILWIEGYSISRKDKKEGKTGNFASVEIAPAARGTFTLKATKLPAERNFHPKKKQKNQQHPNGAHPSLQAIRAQTHYNMVEDAHRVLQLLCEDYPEVCILLSTKAYVMIYSRETSPRVQKYILEIEAQPEGGFRIGERLNTYVPPENIALPASMIPPTETDTVVEIPEAKLGKAIGKEQQRPDEG